MALLKINFQRKVLGSHRLNNLPGVYDDLDTPDLAKVISENSFVCMYLVYQFSKLVDMSATVSNMAGVTHR